MASWPGWVPWRAPRRYGSYVQKFPQHYAWRRDVRRVAREVVRKFGGASCNTYYKHPPPTRRWEYVSLDVWGRRGRGWTLPPKVGNRVWRYLYYRRGIGWAWGYWRGKAWRRYARPQWGRTPPGPPDSDPRHDRHIHISYLI